MLNQVATQDTNREAELVLLELVRKKPAIVRLRDACAASRRVAQQCKNAIRRRHPDLSDDEVKLQFIELHYGKKLASEVRAWLLSKRST